nr:MAG TPA: Cytochrome c oxidase subunit 1 [Bacteriophage sp.]
MMNEKEAIKFLQSRADLIKNDYSADQGADIEDYYQSIKIAIRALGKRIPKKPIDEYGFNYSKPSDGFIQCRCGAMSHVNLYYSKTTTYCWRCGQAFGHWGEGDSK